MFYSGSEELSLSSIVQNSLIDYGDLEKIVKLFSCTHIQAICANPCSTLSLHEISLALSDLLKFEDFFSDLQQISGILYSSMGKKFLELDADFINKRDKLIRILDSFSLTLEDEFVAEGVSGPEPIKVQMILVTLLFLAIVEEDFSGRAEIMVGIIDSLRNLKENWHAKFISINDKLQNIDDDSKDELFTRFQRLVSSSLELSGPRVDHFKSLSETVHEQILSWIDYKTRLAATQVSKKWRLLTCSDWMNSVNGVLLSNDDIDDAKAYINSNLCKIDKNLSHLQVVSIQCIPDKAAHVAVEFKSLENKDETATKVFSVKNIQQYAEQYRTDLCNGDLFEELSICI